MKSQLNLSLYGMIISEALIIFFCILRHFNCRRMGYLLIVACINSFIKQLDFPGIHIVICIFFHSYNCSAAFYISISILIAFISKEHSVYLLFYLQVWPIRRFSFQFLQLLFPMHFIAKDYIYGPSESSLLAIIGFVL